MLCPFQGLGGGALRENQLAWLGGGGQFASAFVPFIFKAKHRQRGLLPASRSHTQGHASADWMVLLVEQMAWVPGAVSHHTQTSTQPQDTSHRVGRGRREGGTSERTNANLKTTSLAVYQYRNPETAFCP